MDENGGGGGGSMMRNSTRVKLLFISLAALVAFMIFILQSRIGHGTVMIIHETIFNDHQADDGSRGDHVDRNHEDGDQQKQSSHHHRGKSHNHPQEVHFVFHESALGAPEFIGRNQQEASFNEGELKNHGNVVFTVALFFE